MPRRYGDHSSVSQAGTGRSRSESGLQPDTETVGVGLTPVNEVLMLLGDPAADRLFPGLIGEPIA
jgi:hypothetical protein